MPCRPSRPHAAALMSFFLVLLAPCVPAGAQNRADKVRVLVWDEQQPKQKKAYPKFLGEQIAAHLRARPELEVKTARLDDPEQGLSTAALEGCDVLVWWGHVRHDDVPDAKAREIVDRIREGRLAMITLHSAHWSVPFMAAMETKAAQDALARLPEAERSRAVVKFRGERRRKVPPRTRRDFLATDHLRRADGSIEIVLDRPHCVFPVCCDPVEPSRMRTLVPDHPIARGIPESFTIPETEMYDAPFGVPAPDLLIFEESWKDGEHFPSGALWRIDAGTVFYFRPGHETYPIFFEEYPLKIVENATVWLGETVRANRNRQASRRAPVEERRLRADHAPTPFSAAEIRAACRPGRSNLSRVSRPGRQDSLKEFRFVEWTEERGTHETLRRSSDRTPLGEPKRATTTWAEFQAHASFKADVTTIFEEEITVPAGTFRCDLYRVRNAERNLETEVWFAHELPGPPILMVHTQAGREIMRMVLVEFKRGRP